MENGDVVSRNRAANAAGTKRHRGHHLSGEADGAQGAHGIDADTKDWFLKTESHDHLVIGRMDDQTVAAPAELDQLDAAVAALLPAVHFVPAQHCGELLARQRLLPPHPPPPPHPNT